MLYLNKKDPTLGPVNLSQLTEVREKYMPTHAVRLAMPCQLKRVADEVSRVRPELREETAFVVQEELALREHLANTSMQMVKGGQRHA
jgi:hypothetical protein